MKYIGQCISNVRTWIFHNKLQVNDDKTEAILVAQKGNFIHAALTLAATACSTPPVSFNIRKLINTF